MKSNSIVYNLIFIFTTGFSTLLVPMEEVAAQEVSVQELSVEGTVIENEFSQAQLEQMLAPIALYPDSLLTHILIASTYPLEVIQAERWLVKNTEQELEAEQLMEQTATMDWDPSIKALLPFPRVLKRLSENLEWTQQLGDAFLQDEESVLNSIQQLRQKAEQAGNLDQMENMEIIYEDDNIMIEPVRQEIVYVPYYDTRLVYGDWRWNHHPPIYWGLSHHDLYYRPHHSLFSWHTGVHISFDFFFSAFRWHDHHVVVMNHHQARHSYSRGYVRNHHSAKRWGHNINHRRGVAYRSNHIKQRYHSNRPSWVQTKSSRSHGGQRVVTNKQHLSHSVNNTSARTSLSSKARVHGKITKHKNISNKMHHNRTKITQTKSNFVNKSPKKVRGDVSSSHKSRVKKEFNTHVDNSINKGRYERVKVNRVDKARLNIKNARKNKKTVVHTKTYQKQAVVNSHTKVRSTNVKSYTKVKPLHNVRTKQARVNHKTNTSNSRNKSHRSEPRATKGHSRRDRSH